MTEEGPLRVLCIAAHPDDSDLSSGGTLAKWAAMGHEVRYVVCTNGDKGSHDRGMSPHRLAELREAEQRAAAEVIGARDVIFLRHRDGELEPSSGFRTELAMLIRHFRPHVIFTHDGWRPYQIHPDHRNVGLTVCDAVVSARDHLFLPAMNAIGLEAYAPSAIYFWGSDAPDYFEDIGETLDRKLQAVSLHRTQLPQMGENWEARVRQWAVDVGARAGMEYAEGFKQLVFRPTSHVLPTHTRGR